MTVSSYSAARGSSRTFSPASSSSRGSGIRVSDLRVVRSGNADFDALMPQRVNDGFRVSERNSIDFDADFDYMDEVGGSKRSVSERAGSSHGESSRAESSNKSKQSKNGFLAIASAAVSEKRRSSRKAKADKEFARQFADVPSTASDEGPRAALYTGEMGSEQRRATRLQAKESIDTASVAKSFSRLSAHAPKTRRGIVGLTVAICLVMTCVLLYTPLQRYYLATRDYDQAVAELDAITERNAELENRVDFLNTKQGAEQSARDQFGWVMPDENAVVVQGLGSEVGKGNELDIVGNVAPGSVPAPEKWYTPLLDAIFGVN